MLGMVQRIYPSIFPCVKLQGSAQVKNVKGMQGLQEIWETVYLSIYRLAIHLSAELIQVNMTYKYLCQNLIQEKVLDW